jgi:hypothetical protein
LIKQPTNKNEILHNKNNWGKIFIISIN